MLIELSSYQIDLMPSLKPDVGVLMNLSPDHLDRHGSMDNYAAVKARMFALQDEGDIAAISVDDSHCARIAVDAARHTQAVTFSVRGAMMPRSFATAGHAQRSIAMARRCRLTMRGRCAGLHNAQNACAVYIAARRLGLTRAADRRRVQLVSRAGTPHGRSWPQGPRGVHQ
jgi:UDP-N-acetylmuramoylalanine--D-glutamate ligase